MKTRVLLVVCAAAIALVVFAGEGDLASGIAGIAFLGVLVAVVASIVTRLLGAGDRTQGILRGRLARGEITPAEFAEAQRILGL